MKAKTKLELPSTKLQVRSILSPAKSKQATCNLRLRTVRSCLCTQLQALCSAVFLLSFLFGSVLSSLETPHTVEQKIIQYFDSLLSLKARFQMKILDHASSGILYYKKPGRFYFQFKRPKGKYYLFDGSRLYVHLPSLRVVAEQRITRPEKDSLQTAKAGVFRLFRIYRASFPDDRPSIRSSRWLKLRAENAYLYWNEVYLLVTEEGQIEKLEGHRKNNILHIKFQSWEKNASVPDQIFHFRGPPHGSHLIRNPFEIMTSGVK